MVFLSSPRTFIVFLPEVNSTRQSVASSDQPQPDLPRSRIAIALDVKFFDCD